MTVMPELFPLVRLLIDSAPDGCIHRSDLDRLAGLMPTITDEDVSNAVDTLDACVASGSLVFVPASGELHGGYWTRPPARRIIDTTEAQP